MSPELSTPSGEPEPLETMDTKAIEAELKTSGIDLPPRWFFSTPKEQRKLLGDARTGKIPKGYKWPSASAGSTDFFNSGFSRKPND